jgi:hypothetical protein
VSIDEREVVDRVSQQRLAPDAAAKPAATSDRVAAGLAFAVAIAAMRRRADSALDDDRLAEHLDIGPRAA